MIKRFLSSKYTFYVASFIFFLIVMSRVSLRLYNPDMSYADDYYFSGFTSFKDTTDWIIGLYNSTDIRSAGSRLIIYFLTASVLSSNIWVWRILNAFFVVLLIYSISRFKGNDINGRVTVFSNHMVIPVFILFLIVVMNVNALYWSIFWASGSFNYLWAPAAMMLCLYPFFLLFDSKGVFADNDKRAYLYIFPMILASSAEQGCAILLVFGFFAMILHGVKSKKISISAVVVYIFAVISLIVHLASPGNATRATKEIAAWCPEYATMSIGEQLFEGYNWTILHHYFVKSHNLIFILLLVLVVVLYKLNARKQFKVMAIASFAYMLLYIILSTISADLPNMTGIYNSKTLDIVAPNGFVVTIPESFKLIPFIIQTAVLLIIPHIIFRLVRLEIGLPLVLIYFASLASSMLMSFSPTLYASGYRVFFMPDLLISAVIVALFTFMLMGITRKQSFYFTFVMIFLFLCHAKVVLGKYIDKIVDMLF